MVNKGRSMLRRNPIVKVLLPLVLVLAMFSQFALPVIASDSTDTAYTDQNFTGDGAANGSIMSVSGGVMGHNTTQGFETDLPYELSTYRLGGEGYWEVTYYLPNDASSWYIDIGIALTTTSGTTDYSYLLSDTPTITTSGSFTGDSPTTATNAATNAYNEAVTAASNASAAQIAANTAATNAANANTNASTAATDAAAAQTAATNANTNASTTVTNTTNDPAADTAITSSTNGMAATYNNTTYNGESAAYWANEAATAAANIVPVISSVVGQNGATCTTSGSFTAIVAVTPSSGVTYTVTGVPGCSSNGNSLTFSGLSHGTAYTADITATYISDGKTSMYPFTFFSI